jgi:hypothetical protein
MGKRGFPAGMTAMKKFFAAIWGVLFALAPAAAAEQDALKPALSAIPAEAKQDFAAKPASSPLNGGRMPLFVPDPRIDYKILVMKPNPRIDFKIQVARPGMPAVPMFRGAPKTPPGTVKPGK